MKKIFAFSLVICALLVLLAGCGNQQPTQTALTTADALKIVLEDLDMELTDLQPHIHSGEFQGSQVYYVYVTVDGENLAYAIDMYSGEILNIAESNHSH